MKKALTAIAVTVLSVGAVAGTASAGQGQSDNAAKSLGKTTIDTDVYDADGGEMLYGDGISNGEWMTAEVQGVVLGLRATDADGTLCQQSWNPNFFGAASIGGYDASAETTYNLRLLLTPETFNGPPLAVTIEVVVSAP